MRLRLGRSGALAVGLVLVGGLFVANWARPREASTARERRAVLSYEAGIRPWQRQGGQLVAEDIKPRLADLELGKVTPEEFRTEAAGWHRTMEKVRQGLARVRVPSRLVPAAKLLDVALRQYERAIDAFAAASTQPKTALTRAITAAVPLAEAADKTYDRADAAIQAERHRVGLPVAPPLP